MKKGLIMLLALFIAGTISLTACQKKEEPAAPAEAPATQEQAPKAPADEAAPTGENAPAAPAEQPAGGK
ncbi:MAG: hypothetical protein HZC13_07595 [Nitrospirae bacterium]|nr:hypothetical protein [Nitrospirota bacterium]